MARLSGHRPGRSLKCQSHLYAVGRQVTCAAAAQETAVAISRRSRADVPDELARRSSYPCGVTSYPAISLFSGVGGLDLGATAAGFDIRAAVEFESDAASSLRANDPDLVVIEKSIVDMPSEEIREAAGVARGELALIIGGPRVRLSRNPATGSNTSGADSIPRHR
jgi:hypothetical protein